MRTIWWTNLKAEDRGLWVENLGAISPLIGDSKDAKLIAKPKLTT